MLTLPEHLISPLVFIEVHGVSLFHVIVLIFLLFDCLVSIFLLNDGNRIIILSSFKHRTMILNKGSK